MIGDFYSKKPLPNPSNKDNPRQTESFAPNLRGRGGPPMPVPPPAPPPPKINNDSTGSDVLAPGSNPLDRIYKANKQKEMEKQGKQSFSQTQQKRFFQPKYPCLSPRRYQKCDRSSQN